MLKLVLQHEWTRLYVSQRFRLLSISCWVLMALALMTGWQQTRQYHASYDSVIHRQQELWERQGDLNPHSATHHGLYAFKPWNALSSWDPGLNPYLGTTVFLESHRQNSDQSKAAQDQLRLSRFAPLTLAALFQIFVPLALFLLAYGAISEERENGTLKLLWVQGLSPKLLFAGKASTLISALVLWIAPALLIGTALMVLDGTVPWGRLLALIAIYGLYWVLCLWAGLLISAWAPDSRLALFIVLGLWLLNVLVVPRVGLGWLQAQHPTISAGAFQAAIRKDLDQLPDWETRRENLRKKALAQYKVKSEKDLPISLEGLILEASENDDTRIHAVHFSQLQARYRQAHKAYGRWGWLFPGIAVQQLSQALASTDLPHHQRFLQAAEAYRQDYVGFLNRDIVKNPKQNAFDYTANQSLWKQVKPFAYQWPSVSQVLSENRALVLALVAWLAFLSALTLWRLRHLRVLA